MMPNKAEEDKTPMSPEAAVVTPKRLRPRWQRWLLWSSVRLLLMLGVGAGVGTVQWRRTRPPDLMAHARRIATVASASGYYWTSEGDLRLYRFTGKGTDSSKWDAATQSAAFVETLPKLKGQIVRPMDDYNLFVIRPNQKISQTKTLYGYTTHLDYVLYSALPKPDYIFKVKPLPNIPLDTDNVTLSRDGKRIAYIARLPHQDWRDAFLQRFKPGYKPPFRGLGAAILVSAVDGSRTDVIGTVKDVEPAAHFVYNRSGTTFSLQGVFWCPDGKHVSFAYGDGVYEVPVK